MENGGEKYPEKWLNLQRGLKDKKLTQDHPLDIVSTVLIGYRIEQDNPPAPTQEPYLSAYYEVMAKINEVKKTPQADWWQGRSRYHHRSFLKSNKEKTGLKTYFLNPKFHKYFIERRGEKLLILSSNLKKKWCINPLQPKKSFEWSFCECGNSTFIKLEETNELVCPECGFVFDEVSPGNIALTSHERKRRARKWKKPKSPINDGRKRCAWCQKEIKTLKAPNQKYCDDICKFEAGKYKNRERVKKHREKKGKKESNEQSRVYMEKYRDKKKISDSWNVGGNKYKAVGLAYEIYGDLMNHHFTGKGTNNFGAHANEDQKKEEKYVKNEMKRRKLKSWRDHG